MTFTQLWHYSIRSTNKSLRRALNQIALAKLCGEACVLGHKILQDLFQNNGGDSSMGTDRIQLEYSWLVWEHTGHQKQNENFYLNKLALKSMKMI